MSSAVAERLRVAEYSVVTQNGTVEQGGCKFQLSFHCSYVSSSYRF